MKFEDCAPKVRVLHDVYGFGKIYRRNMENGGSVFVDFNGIKRIFFNNKNKDIPYHVSELKRVPKNKNKLFPRQIIRYLKSDSVQRIYEELKKKYNIPIGYKDEYKFKINGSTCVFYKSIKNKSQQIEVSAKCHPEDKFDVRIGLELAVRRLAEKLGVCKEEKKEIKDKKEGWLPKNGDLYWSVTVTDDGLDNVSAAVWTKISSLYWGNLLSVAIGNCFKTKEEAEKNIDRIKEKYRKMIEYSKTLNT